MDKNLKYIDKNSLFRIIVIITQGTLDIGDPITVYVMLNVTLML